MFDELKFLDIINILSLVIGLENLELNEKQVNSLMSEMRDHQNAMLTKAIEQNKVIIQQNEEIIRLIKESNYAQNSNPKNN